MNKIFRHITLLLLLSILGLVAWVSEPIEIAATQSHDSSTSAASILGANDLELVKEFSDPNTFYNIGDTIKFNLTVYNKGMSSVKNVIIKDKLSPSLTNINDPILNSGWTFAANQAEFTISDTIQPNANSQICIYQIFSPDPLATEFDLVSNSEIDSAQTEMGGPFVDDEPANDQSTLELINCSSMACFSNQSVLLDAFCDRAIVPADVLLGNRFPDQFYTITIIDQDNVPHENMFGADDVDKEFIVSVAFPFCDNISCWAKVKVKRNQLPEFNSPCEFVRGEDVFVSEDVRVGDFVKVSTNGKTFSAPKVPTGDTLMSEMIMVDSSCQDLTLNLTSTLKHYSVNHGGHDPDWVHDTIYWEIMFSNKDVLSGSGVAVSTGSGTFYSGEFEQFKIDTAEAGKYVLNLAIIPATNKPGYLTTQGPDGKIFGTISTTDCIPTACEVWCPSLLIPEDVITLKELRDQLDTLACFSDVYLSQQRTTRGSLCDSLGFVVILTYTGEVEISHGNFIKKTLLEQAYRIIQPEPTSQIGLIVSTEHVVISCGDDSSPLGIYEKLLKRELDSLKTLDVWHVYKARLRAASKAFPYLSNPHEKEDFRFQFPDIIDHQLKEKENHIKVLKFYDELTGDFVENCIPNQSNCKPVWVKKTIVEKEVVEVIIPGGDTTISIDQITPLVSQDLCGYSAKYDDVTFPACGGGSKIRRSWNILNWCTGEIIDATINSQNIIFKDDTPPVIVNKIGDFSVSIDPWVCIKTFEIDENDIAVDECSNEHGLFFQWSAAPAMVDGNKITVWIGDDVTVKGKIGDICGNIVDLEFKVTVLDRVPPVAIAHDVLNITVTGAEDVEARAKIMVGSVDAGSHDSGCSEIISCLIRDEDYQAGRVMLPGGVNFSTDGVNFTWRPDELGLFVNDGQEAYNPGNPCYSEIYVEYYHDKFGKVTGSKSFNYVTCDTYVKFCCIDTDSSGYINVVLRVKDHAGNYSNSWTRVHVEDKSGNGWSCISSNVTCIGIDNFAPSIPTYGSILCDPHTVREISRSFNTQCGEGTIDILWAAYDEQGNEISQDVCSYHVVRPDDYGFDPKSIKWPKHYDGSTHSGINKECKEDDILTSEKREIEMGKFFTCNSNGETGEPVWCDSQCDLILAAYEDESVPDDATCGKVIRRWTVIDWCTWKPNGNSSADDTNDKPNNIFQAVEDWTIGEVCDDCDTRTGTPDNVYFQLTEVEEDGYYTFDQLIKLNDEDAPIITAEDAVISTDQGNSSKVDPDYSECIASGVASITVVDDCNGMSSSGGITVSWKFQDREGFGTNVDLTDLPSGEYTILWTARDACGNESSKEQRVLIQDLKFPTPVCRQDVSTATMKSDGTTTIWAKDFDLGSFDNCSDIDVFFKNEDGDFVPSLVFNCDALSNGKSESLSLEMYAVDAQGNSDFCRVNLRIDDSQDNCLDIDEGAAIIAGEVRTEEGDMVENVEVNLNRSHSDMTNVEGQYVFNTNVMGSTYDISSKKDNDFLNGVSAVDLVLIKRHVLGIQTLDSPYKVIAGDINADARISAVDIVELRKLILGLSDKFNNNESWRFVDASQRFDNPSMPFPFTEILSISNLSSNMMEQDFIGVKIGDVNGNAVANSAITASGRSNQALSFLIENQPIKKGQTITIPVYSSNFSDVSAFQYTMKIDGLSFVEVVSSNIGMDNGNIGRIDQNTLTVVWSSEQSISHDHSDLLFTMKFISNVDSDLQSNLELSDDVTRKLAYKNSDEAFDVGLDFNSATESIVNHEFELRQNSPNPFNKVTTIEFVLPYAGPASIAVFDITGKLVKEIEGQYPKGANQIILNRKDLGGNGLLYYQLENGEYSSTRKMILMD